MLKDILPANRPLDVETIQREVARYYKVTVEALKEDRRHKALAHARQVAMYLSRRLTKSRFPEIGVALQQGPLHGHLRGAQGGAACATPTPP